MGENVPSQDEITKKFRFSRPYYDRLEKLRTAGGFSGNAAAIKQAIKLFAFLAEMVRDNGNTIELHDPSGTAPDTVLDFGDMFCVKKPKPPVGSRQTKNGENGSRDPTDVLVAFKILPQAHRRIQEIKSAAGMRSDDELLRASLAVIERIVRQPDCVIRFRKSDSEECLQVKCADLLTA